MSKTTILVNLGNRNIKINNKGYKNDFIPNAHFRQETQSILKNFESEKENIELNILPPIIEKFTDATIVLFATDQDSNNFQDTLFEAEIIKKLITNKYGSTHADIEIIKNINPTDENELISFYTNFLRQKMNQIDSDDLVVYYDTGGTTQQKNSLRAVLEFYLSSHQLKQFYGAFSNEQTILKELTRTKSEELKLKRQIKNLMLTYNYSAVQQLSEDIRTHKAFKQLNALALLSWNNLHVEVKKKYPYQQLNKGIKQHHEYKNLELLYLDDKKNITYQKSVLLLNKFHALLKNNDYSGAVITLQQLIETYTLGLISEHVSIDLTRTKRFHRDQGIILDEVLKDYGQEITREYGKEVKSFSLPVQLIFLGLHADVEREEKEIIEKIKTVITTFNGSIPNNKRLDVFRNSIAHKGKGVTDDIFTIFYKEFIEAIDSYFDYQKDQNIYDTVNKMAIYFL